MAFALPPGLKAALDRLGHGRSRSDMAPRAEAISTAYRGGGDSAVIRTFDDALAYALTRMPATYAAVAACLAEIARLRPAFAPASLIDAGAGPGTASWAAIDAFASLCDIQQLDANTALRDLARELAHDVDRFAALRSNGGDLRKSLADAAASPLVIASYVMGEITEADRADVADLLWSKTQDTLLVVEPGTPAGYARVIGIRTRLIAAGASVIAPCPHDSVCPLPPPDWCHFTQRLARTRDHKQVKGAALPFEDEKYCYVALARAVPASRPSGRVLAQPDVTKVEVTTKLCMEDGRAVIARSPRRDKSAYARAKRLNWGDAVSEL
jgi:ribosomal protein RSM22 (predicted rRNA methylase)